MLQPKLRRIYIYDMLLILDSELSDPPSSRTCFRDTTLYANMFLETDIVVECHPRRVDFYWYWLKQGGAMDYVNEIISFGAESGLSIRKDFGGTLNLDRLNEFTLPRVINFINNLQQYR